MRVTHQTSAAELGELPVAGEQLAIRWGGLTYVARVHQATRTGDLVTLDLELPGAELHRFGGRQLDPADAHALQEHVTAMSSTGSTA